jgi:hypothetical protein
VSNLMDIRKTVKIAFPLQQIDGYSPFSEEFLHVTEMYDDVCEIDSIPFFICGVNLHDQVVAIEKNGKLVFDSLRRSNGHPTYRLFFEKKDQIVVIRETMKAMGCSGEGSHLPSLVAVDVPPTVDAETVLQYLVKLKSKKMLDFEDSKIE